MSEKALSEISVRIALSLQVSLGIINIFIMLSVLIHEHSKFLHLKLSVSFINFVIFSTVVLSMFW